MEGKKPCSSTLDGHCCLSSGPRSVALIPTFALATDADGVVVNLYDAGTATLSLRDRTPVAITVATRYPAESHISVTVSPKSKRVISLKLRVSAWCRDASFSLGNGSPMKVKAGEDNDQAAAEDGFAVKLDEPVSVQRVVFAHGKTFHDGGWFDASAGQPRLQVKAAPDAAWETVAELKDYPAATATDTAGRQAGQRCSCSLPAPLKVTAIRVIGKPASGDNPKQACSSCAELQAFAKTE